MLQNHLFDIILGEIGEGDKKLVYRNIILEVPPKELRFLKSRGYITLDRGYITREMREKVLEIRLDYYTRDPKNGIYDRVNFKAEDFVGIRKSTD